MKKLICMITIFMGFLLLFVPTGYCSYHNADNLYEIFNYFFYNGSSTDGFSGDIEMMQSSYFVPDSNDSVWGTSGDSILVDTVYQKGNNFDSTLGYSDSDGYHSLVNLSGNDYLEQCQAHFDVQSEFVWTDTINLFNNPFQRWYSDNALNPLGAKDHFLAFHINDNDLIANYNNLFGTSYDVNAQDIWFIAFENGNLGDGNYMDLAAVVVENMPIPGAVLLMASGIVLLGWRRRFSKK